MNFWTQMLPREKGIWGVYLQTVTVGLLAGFSSASLCLALLGLTMVLSRQPFIRLMRQGLRDPGVGRSSLVVLALLSAMAVAATVGAMWVGHRELRFFLPLFFLALGLPLCWDLKRKSRELLPELVSPAVFAFLGAAMVLGSGGGYLRAFWVWALLAGIFLPTILYVRQRLRLERGQLRSRTPTLIWHALPAAALVILVAKGMASLPLLLIYLALTARAAWGLSRWRIGDNARAVGFQEMAIGLGAALGMGLVIALTG